jgi:hypothetical protein
MKLDLSIFFVVYTVHERVPTPEPLEEIFFQTTNLPLLMFPDERCAAETVAILVVYTVHARVYPNPTLRRGYSSLSSSSYRPTLMCHSIREGAETIAIYICSLNSQYITGYSLPLEKNVVAIVS